MNRYLLSISYIGTRFRGIQKTINKREEPRLDRQTVQGCIELALQALHPVNPIETVLSSRTDAGVHALHSTVHVDLEHHNGQPYDEKSITGVLNKTLLKDELPIRVLNTRLVPDTFHCRYNAQGRTYLYRLAVANGTAPESDLPVQQRSFLSFLPVEEIDRCFFIQNENFDVERFKAASRMFLGLHDFRTFMSTNRQQNPSSQHHPRFTLRTISDISIRSGRSVAIGGNEIRAEELYNYWDIEISGRSFLYKQVRRIVGALVALATDRIDEKCIYEMLTIPNKDNWNPRVLLAPACGLYLKQVHYNEQDFLPCPSSQ